MHGVCKLCKKEANLEISHFIPKFIGKWVKKTSITGFLREKNSVNKRSQDLAKDYWLCGDCEDLFSTWETHFANKVFYPFVDKDQSIASYSNWLPKFCASLSWRTLTHIRSKNNKEDKPEDYWVSLDKAESHLSDYLLMDIVGNSKNLFIYTKLPSFMVFGFINVENPKEMRSSRVSLKYGKLSPRDYRWPDGFIDYVVEKSKEITELSGKISKKQQEKIEEFIKNNPDKAAESKQFEAFLHDYGMFGDDVFR